MHHATGLLIPLAIYLIFFDPRVTVKDDFVNGEHEVAEGLVELPIGVHATKVYY